ncbi:MAG: SDR family NAD(P)-dependent oxidoreductase [Sphingomonadales bacterium]|jgi:NAD(P)-dependent dehydrogenase (short-subunit alcohol dehydrogenase family)
MSESVNKYGLNLQLQGKAVLITGATSGLGRQFALALAKQGAIPIISGRREDRLQALATEIEALGEASHILTLDVCKTDKIASKFEEAWSFENGLWGLVNNSGVAASAPATETSESDYDFVMDTNAKGAFFLSQAFGKKLIAEQRPGHIVNIASIAAFKSLKQNSVYCMSKAAVAQMTKVLAHEWSRFDINVNAICPGYIKTEINAAFFESDAGVEYVKSFPRRRVGKDSDLNELLLYLLSPCSHFITGSLFTADDGQSLD